MARRVKYDWFYDGDNDVYGDDATVNFELRGYDGNDRLFGNDGDDLLLGGDGNDRLWGGRGDDILRGGSGDDRLYIDRGNNTYDGGSGDDSVRFDRVTTFSSNGWFTNKFESFNVGFSVDIRTGDTRAQTLTLSGPSAAYTDFWGTNTFENIQQIWMTPNDDVLRDNNGGHELFGGSGNDLIEGRGGADRIDGGSGSDTASYESAGDSVIVDLGTNRSSWSDAEGDTFTSIENIRGSAHTDYLYGSTDGNRIDGGGDDDLIIARGGADTLIGGAGNDIFFYDQTFDSTVATSGRDTILDFVRGSDRIGLSVMDAISTTNADDAFSFIGGNAFTGSAGQLRVSMVEDAGGDLFNRVEGDVNGDARADFAIAVYANGATLTRSDFIL